MRLINFGTGEIVDRITILDLKIEHGDPALVDHFRKERSALLAKTLPLGVSTADCLELAMVNGLLWRAEDDLRRFRDTGNVSIAAAEVGFRIQELNDHRASLIEKINKQTGEHYGSEKL